MVILGAGAAGLGAALRLRRFQLPFRLLERDDVPGGLARTDVLDGFSFERTAHLLHFRSREVAEQFRTAGTPLRRIARRSAILFADREIPYPFQYNLWALPRGVSQAVLAETQKGRKRNGPMESFADTLTSAWGETAVATFFRPYNEKLWGRRLEDLPVDCAGAYIPPVDLQLIEQGARHRVHYEGYNGAFFFPDSGRLGDVMNALAVPLDCIDYETTVVGVDLQRREVRTEDGSTMAYQALINTLPLAELLAMACLEPSPELFAATELVNVRVGLRGRLRTRSHWIYIVDPDIPFHRIGLPSNINPHTCPADSVSLSIEYTVPRDREAASPEAIAETAIEYLAWHGLVEANEAVLVSSATVSPAYVVHRAPGRGPFSDIIRTLREHNVLLAGRFGIWDYLSIEEAFKSGARAADRCTALPA